jgi:hypothetical protein
VENVPGSGVRAHNEEAAVELNVDGVDEVAESEDQIRAVRVALMLVEYLLELSQAIQLGEVVRLQSEALDPGAVVFAYVHERLLVNFFVCFKVMRRGAFEAQYFHPVLYMGSVEVIEL